MAQSDRTSAEHLEAEAAIREVERTYDAAWQAGDLDGLLACLSPDAVLINPFGDVAAGHAEIRSELATVLSGSAASQRHTSMIMRVALVTDDVAVVDGEAVLEGSRNRTPFSHRFTDVLVRQKEGWRVAHIRAYRYLEPRR